MKISLAMIVKNEEQYIERCLSSVQDLVDEIVIVDTGSNDRTIEIIKQFSNVKLYEFLWCDDFSKARNYSIERTTGDYILVLDADEYVVDGSRDSLEEVMIKNLVGKILIRSRFKKDKQEYESNAYVSRFFSNDIRYTGAIHEQLDTNKKRININLQVNHDGYFEKNKSKRNIPLLLKQVKSNPQDPYYLFQLGKELRISDQFKESFYFLKNAYKNIDKNESYYGELVVEIINCGKEYGERSVFEIIAQNDNRLENLCDFHFAKGLFYMDYCVKQLCQAENYIKLIELNFLKCLKLSESNKVEIVKGTGSFLAAYNLGVYYEVTENLPKAINYFEMASEWGYILANERILQLNTILKTKN